MQGRDEMRSWNQPAPQRFVEYDALRHRVWILGQRCHHGATGTVVATAACLALVRQFDTPLLALAAAGGALMVHDWKDHSAWFRLGHQE
jgi:hypothetical protein